MSDVVAPALLCDVDASWEDVRGVFAQRLQGLDDWSCICLPGVDKERNLSAPEIMDPKTDASVGCNCVFSLDYLLSSGALSLSSTSLLVDDGAMVDFLDVLFMRELHYLQGYSLVHSILAFPYFLRLDALRDVSPVLHAYCRAALRCLDYIVRAVYATSVRSDEEFTIVPPEVDRQANCAVEDIVAELDGVLARTTHDALAARLRFRRDFLGALHLFVDAQQSHDIVRACSMCADLAALLGSSAYTRSREPALGESQHLLREHEVAHWISALTPPAGTVPSRSFGDATAVYCRALTQLASLRTLYSLPTLNMVSEFIERFSAQQPMLPVRCIAVLVLFQSDPLVSFLHGPALPRRVVDELANVYGAPLYLRVFTEDERCIEHVVKYRIHALPESRKLTVEDVTAMRRQSIDAVRQWATEACRHYLVYLEALLCNRGLAHRRLMNTMAELAHFRDLSYFVDTAVFVSDHLATSPDVVAATTAEAAAQCSKCSSVLTLFARERMLCAMESVLQLSFELDVLTPGEVVPALWYMNFVQRTRAENASLLCLRDTAFLPPFRVNKRSQVPLYNLALCTRLVGTYDAIAATLADVARMLSDVTFLAACLYEQKHLIDLTSAAKYALMRVEDAFDHRFYGCFGALRDPLYMSYAQCVGVKTQMQADAASSVKMYARKGSEIATTAAEMVRVLLRTHEHSDPADTSPTVTSSAASDVTRAPNVPSEQQGKSERSDGTRTAPKSAPANGDSSRNSHTTVARRVAVLGPLLLAMERTARSTAASLAMFAELCDDDDVLALYEVRLERPAMAHLVTFVMHKKASA